MKKKTNSLAKILFFLFFMIVAGAIGYFVGKYVVKNASAVPASVLIAIAVFFIPAFFIVIGVHELGHVTAGLLMKFEFKSITVGPFMWEKQQHGIKFRWNKNVNTSGGLALCLPVGAENLSKRFAVYAAGGPLASIVLAIVTFLLSRLAVGGATDGNTATLVMQWLLMEICLLSAIIAVATLIPIHTGGFSSDGARIFNLLKGGDVTRFELLILKLMSAATSGLRPALYNIDDLHEARQLAVKLNAPFGVYLHSFFHQAAFDNGELDAAEIHLKDYIEEADAIPNGVRGMVWLDAAFFYAYAKKDLAQAQQYYEMFKPAALIPKAQVSATEAAISILKNDMEQAVLAITAAQTALPDMIDRGNAVALKDKLLIMKNATSSLPENTVYDINTTQFN